jgi:hypothetical protein
LGTFQIRKLEIWFKYSNLNQGFKQGKINQSKAKNLKQYLNLYGNQDFGF